MRLLLLDLLLTSYNLFTKQDYPSPGFLKKILIDEQVSPIFAINQNKSEVFKQFKVNFIIVSSPLLLGSFRIWSDFSCSRCHLAMLSWQDMELLAQSKERLTGGLGFDSWGRANTPGLACEQALRALSFSPRLQRACSQATYCLCSANDSTFACLAWPYKMAVPSL